MPDNTCLLNKQGPALAIARLGKREASLYPNLLSGYPQEMDTPEIEAFLTYLAVDQHVAPSTQNQALSALLFLYQHVLNKELQARIDAARAKKSQRLPPVLTCAEAWRVIDAMSVPTA